MVDVAMRHPQPADEDESRHDEENPFDDAENREAIQESDRTGVGDRIPQVDADHHRLGESDDDEHHARRQRQSTSQRRLHGEVIVRIALAPTNSPSSANRPGTLGPWSVEMKMTY